MERDQAYQRAQQKIEEARRMGATQLDFSMMNLTSIPESLGLLTQLHKVDLGWNLLTTLPEWLSNLTQLQTLDLSNNQLTTLPEWLGNLTQLQTLDLSNNQLTTLPEWLGNLTQLQTLDLGNNQLTTLPEWLGNLTQLQTLDLGNNQLMKVPESLGNLTQLRLLDLGSNKLAILPDSLGNLTQLQELRLYRNQLMQLPEVLGNLTQLQELNLFKNRFSHFPEALRKMRLLRVLLIHKNQFKTIPSWIGELHLLQRLFIHAHQIMGESESIKELQNLRSLSLWGAESVHQVDQIPESIRYLKQLELLDASGIGLVSLPDWLNELTELERLELKQNNLIDLPSSLGQLTQLQTLNLQGNPLNPDLAAAYEQGRDVLLQYLRERAVEETVLNEAKLIMVGEGGVGKSSLLGALRGDEWVEGRITTHGLEVKPVKLTAPGSGVELTLNGWDFGGQPVYRPTHQLFFSAPAVYLVVWEPRKGPEQGFVNYWTKLIKSRAYDEKRPNEKPHILIVATHGGPKERQAHIDEQALREQFGDLIVGFYHVDSFTGAGIDELKQAIARTAELIPQVGRKVPGSWKRVIDALKLRSEREPYISYAQFVEICQAQQVSEFTTEIYARILHELGYIIHYGDDESLKDIVILRAEWLSKAISFVLEDREVKEHNGLIHHSRLAELWNDPAKPESERYPPKLHPIFLRLMERFDLSYRVVFPNIGRDDAPSDTSLIAQLVRGSRPEGLSKDWGPEPDSGDAERTQICRVVDATTGVPASAEGLMYQLIVRLHRYSLGRDDYTRSRHWQLGLLLDAKYNGRALLEQIGTDIRITVRAAYPERFLHMLSEEVKWLVDHFWKGLNCHISVPCELPCRGSFEIEALIDSRKQGYPTYRCSVCRRWMNIDALLAKPLKLPPHDEALVKLNQSIDEIKRGMEEGFQSVRVDLRRLISQVDEQFAALMTSLVDEARDGPRLFSLTPVEPRLWSKPKWISQKVRLTLWCEHSRMPLPELGDDPSYGVYELEMTREWLVKVAPYAKLVAGVLSLALPVASSAIKWTMDETAYKQIEEDLDLSEKSFSGLLGVGRGTGSWLAHDDEASAVTEPGQADTIRAAHEDELRYGTPKAAQGALLREVQALLKERDPGFGGLMRVQNKRRQFLWIHQRFEKEYYPDLPVIPQAQP